jgi:hypothetical protein
MEIGLQGIGETLHYLLTLDFGLSKIFLSREHSLFRNSSSQISRSVLDKFLMSMLDGDSQDIFISDPQFTQGDGSSLKSILGTV